MLSIQLIPGAINDLLATVNDTHCLTKADRYGIMAAIIDEATTDEERGSLDRLLRSFVKGRIKLCDELCLG